MSKMVILALAHHRVGEGPGEGAAQGKRSRIFLTTPPQPTHNPVPWATAAVIHEEQIPQRNDKAPLHSDPMAIVASSHGKRCSRKGALMCTPPVTCQQIPRACSDPSAALEGVLWVL